MRIRVALLAVAAVSAPVACQTPAPVPLAELFADAFVIDGALNPTRKKDPSCRQACETELMPLVEVTPLTGVHAGSCTCSGELERVRALARWVREQAGGMLVETFNDLHDARRQGRHAVLLYSQKVPRLDGDPAGVAEWFDAGIRIVQPAYSSREPLPHLRAGNKLAGGADEPGVGLTELGRAVIGELVDRHMIVDVSHCSERTTMEVIAMTDGPILANHANAKALTVTMRDGRPLGRNKTDRELQAIAATGGVVGINTVGWMLDRDGDGRTGIDDFLAHVDYCVKLIGIDHVGLSSDAIVDGWAPDDIHYADAALAGPDRWRVVARRLREDYDYTDAMLRKLLGGNFLRVYDAVLPGLGAPQPTAPDDGATVGAGSVVLEWRAAAARGVEPPTYDVDIDGERRATGLTEPRLELADLDRGQSHRWRVLARSGRWVTASAWRALRTQ